MIVALRKRFSAESGVSDMRAILLAPGTVLMVAGFLLPLLVTFWISAQPQDGIPFAAYSKIARSTLFWRVAWNTFQIAFLSAALSIAFGYPIALHMSRQTETRRRILTMIILIPFWTSILVKSYAFIVMLGREGLLNQAILAIFPDAKPIDLLFNRAGLAIGMTHQIIPFAVLPILASLLAIDGNLARAARVMGASELTIFSRITLPLSVPGILAAFLLVFTIGLGAYITPALLGGERDIMIANLIDLRLRDTLDWPGASAIALTLAVTVSLLIVLSRYLASMAKGSRA